MTVARRLIVLLAVPLLALVGLELLTYHQLWTIERTGRFIWDVQIPSITVLGQLSRSVEGLRVNARDYLLASDADGQSNARIKFDAAEVQVHGLLNDYGDRLISNDTDRRLFEDYKALVNEYIAEAKAIMSSSAEGRRQEALARLNGPAFQIGERMRNVADEWIELNETLANDAGKNAASGIDVSQRSMLIANIACVLVTAVLGYRTFRRIVTPIRGLQATVKTIAAGDYAQLVPSTDQPDEIGGLARSIDVLKQGAAATEEQRWVKTNASKLTGELQGASSLDEFGQRLLSGLIPIIGGGVAGFYVYEETPRRLSRIAAYGLPEHAAASFAIGQGLVGQCAQERRTLTLTNLPPDYLRITSGVGAAAPAQAIAAPLLSHESLLGVVEIAMFQSLGARENALIDELFPVVALSLQVLQRNLRTQQQAAQLRESSERLAASEERSRLILESSAEGIFGTDTQGTITFVNPAACAMLGFTADELIGKPSHATFHHHRPDGTDYPKELCPMYAAYTQGKASRIDNEYLWRKEGTGVPVEYGATPIRKDGKLFGSVISFTDISERKQAEKKLKRFAEELERTNFLSDSALELTKAGYWHVPLDGSGFYNSSERAQRIFGDLPTPDMRQSLDAWAANVRAGDETAAKITAENFQAAIDGTIPSYDATYAYKRPIDGRVVWIHALGHIVKDSSGKPTDMYGVTQDITAFKQLEAELRAAMAKAEEATKAKSAFLANMSHEIRTPMNGVIGMTELALDTDLTAEQRDYLNTVKWSADALLTLINDILDFSKIEAGRIELDPIEFLLRDAISDTLNPLALRASSKALELAYDIAPDVPDALIADIYRLRQVIVNLVGNAIKFTDKGEVVVSIRQIKSEGEDRILEVAVRDTGIGIAPEAAAKLFRPFEQAEAGTTRKYGGTGLGLAISRQLVELMGGQIQLQSEAGKGSQFIFTTRVKVGASRAAAQSDDAFQLLRDKTVLIVDDNATNRRILETMLGHWGLRTLSADSGAKALAALDRSGSAGQNIWLIISDLHMPEMDGFELIEAIRRHAAFNAIPVILLTSSASPGDQKRSDELRVAARLLKPVKQSLLLDNILRIMSPVATERSAAPALPAVPVETASATASLRVLLAEDNPVNVKFALKVLQLAGHTVTVVNNGKQAVDQWRSDPVDLVLMDLQMPEMDGLEATRAIRAAEKERNTHTPIIAMTANAMAGDREICFEAGMDGYVAKPVKKDLLLAEIQRVMTTIGGGRAARV